MFDKGICVKSCVKSKFFKHIIQYSDITPGS
ncbi:hypothetical protein T08_1971 [Trichinella sp. T8]|nr:hypothetical protein T08_1971 [Trichinella sp. T8]